MSSDRRKSKHPKKCEDFVEPQESIMNTKSPTNYLMDSHSSSDHIRRNDGEVSFFEVLQGSSNGYFAECKTCAVQLKDWFATVKHLWMHRSTFVPMCAKDNEYSRSNQSATCMMCQKVCDNMSHLSTHARSKHTFTQPPFVCPFCGRNFASSFFVLKHIDVSDVSMKCPICSAPYNQEYELYVHLSNCLPTFHPHMKIIFCPICDQSIVMSDVPDHMIEHSQKRDEIVKEFHHKIKYPADLSCKNPTVFQNELSKHLFLCEICDRRIDCRNIFTDHLHSHPATNMFCPLCCLKGFDDTKLLVRHMLLRCPRRSREQVEFGAVVSTIGKEQRLTFIQVLKMFFDVPFFREGLHAWTSYPEVGELMYIVKDLSEDDLRNENCPTDVSLLLWLSDYEKHGQNKPLRDSDLMMPKEGLAFREPLEKIKKNHPYITFLHDVNTDRLKPLYDEALELMEGNGRLNEDKSANLKDTFVRLEWEAQYLRKLEPFYFPGTQRERRKFSPLYKEGKLPLEDRLDTESLKEIQAKLLKSPEIKVDKQIDLDTNTVQRLLMEAKEC